MGRVRPGAALLSVLAPAFFICALAGCGNSGSVNASNSGASPSGAPAPAKSLYTLDTPVNRIAADPRGKAVLVRDVPGLMASKNYPLFDDMSLSQIAFLSGGRLSKTKLALVQSDLTQISGTAPPP